MVHRRYHAVQRSRPGFRSIPNPKRRLATRRHEPFKPSKRVSEEVRCCDVAMEEQDTHVTNILILFAGGAVVVQMEKERPWQTSQSA